MSGATEVRTATTAGTMTADSLAGPSAWAQQSAITDPGRHTPLFDALVPDGGARRGGTGSAESEDGARQGGAGSAVADGGPSGSGASTPAATVDAVCGSVRGLVSHYVGAGIAFSQERRAEADSRWVEDIVDSIVRRDPRALTEPREPVERFVGCCRDFTALTIAALRHHGIPARSRVGFADYFGDGFWYDHVVAEYWDGGAGRWVRVDAQFPGEWNGVNMRDIDTAGSRFRGAAEVWLDHRAGRIDDEQILDYGASPELPLAGAYFVRNYVLIELAHLAGIETLLWDTWGAMLQRPLRRTDDHALVDRVATVLLDRDVSRETLEELLAEPGLDPHTDTKISLSPSGAFQQPVTLAR